MGISEKERRGEDERDKGLIQQEMRFFATKKARDMTRLSYPALYGLFFYIGSVFVVYIGNTRRYLLGTAVKKGALNTPTVILFFQEKTAALF